MIAERLNEVREEIRQAAIRAGRMNTDVRLMAVTKGVSANRLVEAVQDGQFLFGENYVQEGCTKIEEVRRFLADDAVFSRIEWHFIGHLQTNKAKSVAGRFHCLETLDSLELASGLNRRCEAVGVRMNVLIQVNIGSDPGKSGISPANVQDFLQALQPFPNLFVRGFMTITPYSEDLNQVRLWYRALRHLRDRMQKEFNELQLTELSMGMSHDFPVAVEEGATIVRVGTAIFGARSK